MNDPWAWTIGWRLSVGREQGQGTATGENWDNCNRTTILKKKENYFLKDYIYLFLDKGEGREKEGEEHQCVVASHVPLLGTWPASQAYALTGNRTGEPLVLRPALNPLSHTSQGRKLFFKVLKQGELKKKKKKSGESALDLLVD